MANYTLDTRYSSCEDQATNGETATLRLQGMCLWAEELSQAQSRLAVLMSRADIASMGDFPDVTSSDGAARPNTPVTSASSSATTPTSSVATTATSGSTSEVTASQAGFGRGLVPMESVPQSFRGFGRGRGRALARYCSDIGEPMFRPWPEPPSPAEDTDLSTLLRNVRPAGMSDDDDSDDEPDTPNAWPRDIEMDLEVFNPGPLILATGFLPARASPVTPSPSLINSTLLSNDDLTVGLAQPPPSYEEVLESDRRSETSPPSYHNLDLPSRDESRFEDADNDTSSDHGASEGAVGYTSLFASSTPIVSNFLPPPRVGSTQCLILGMWVGSERSPTDVGTCFVSSLEGLMETEGYISYYSLGPLGFLYELRSRDALHIAYLKIRNELQWRSYCCPRLLFLEQG